MKKEEVKIIFNNNIIRIEQIKSNGVISPSNFYYDQDETEYVLLEQGSAVIEFEDHQLNLRSGDHLLIKAHLKHRISYTSEDASWYCIFFKP